MIYFGQEWSGHKAPDLSNADAITPSRFLPGWALTSLVAAPKAGKFSGSSPADMQVVPPSPAWFSVSEHTHWRTDW